MVKAQLFNFTERAMTSETPSCLRFYAAHRRTPHFRHTLPSGILASDYAEITPDDEDFPRRRTRHGSA